MIRLSVTGMARAAGDRMCAADGGGGGGAVERP